MSTNSVSVNKSIGFVLIAFGDDYLRYAQNLIDSIGKYVSNPKQIYVFTDDTNFFCKNRVYNFDIRVIKVPVLQWPEASSDRYRLISEVSEVFKEEYLFYLDVDSVIVDKFQLLEEYLDDSELFMVHHPGYFNRSIFFKIYKKYLVSSWESNRKFSCFVPLQARKHYVCGGFWGGERDSFLRLCALLNQLSIQDLAKEIYPRSYDESYLNWYFANHRNIKLLTPKYGFVTKFEWLRKKISQPVIIFEEKDPIIFHKKQMNDKN